MTEYSFTVDVSDVDPEVSIDAIHRDLAAMVLTRTGGTFEASSATKTYTENPDHGDK